MKERLKNGKQKCESTNFGAVCAGTAGHGIGQGAGTHRDFGSAN